MKKLIINLMGKILDKLGYEYSIVKNSVKSKKLHIASNQKVGLQSNRPESIFYFNEDI